MSTFNTATSSSIQAIRTVDPTLLKTLFVSHADFFERNGIDIEEKNLDLGKITEIMIHGQEGMPAELADAFFHADQLQEPDQVESVLEELQAQKIEIPNHLTGLEIILTSWIIDKRIVEKKLLEQELSRPYSFESFTPSERINIAFSEPTTDTLREIEESLDLWFDKTKKGTGSRVFVFPKGDECWFVVRHGDTLKRQTTYNNGKSGTIYYRPERNDILIYDLITGDFRISASSLRLREQYRKIFAYYIFKNYNHFSNMSKYTLDQLLIERNACLETTDIEGIEWICLNEIGIRFNGFTAIFKSENVEENVFQFIPPDYLNNGKPTRVKFSVKFVDAFRSRSFEITSTNVIKFARDDDSRLIEQWLEKRGFINTDSNGEEVNNEKALRVS